MITTTAIRKITNTMEEVVMMDGKTAIVKLLNFKEYEKTRNSKCL